MARGRRRQDAELGRVHVLVNGQDEVDAACDCGVAVAHTQRMTGIVDGIDGRRARRVDCKAIDRSGQRSDARRVRLGCKANLGPLRLNMCPILLLMMPGSTPVAA